MIISLVTRRHVSYRNRGKLSFVVVLAMILSAAKAQQTPVTANKARIGQVTSERAKDKEEQLAKVFEGIREDAKLPRLSRIKHRDSLEEIVCTIALTDEPPKRSSSATRGFYKTATPESATPELNKVALFSDLHPKYNPRIARYSVAVWPVKDRQAGVQTYWVGVQLYWSAGMEFFDYHFTDDIYYHNEWKKSIAPSCRGK